MRTNVPIKKTRVSVFTIPTDAPEADGTLSWNSTTMVLVEISAGDQTGVGYSYASESAGTLIEKFFSKLLEGKDALSNTAVWTMLREQVRNIGCPGIAATAISAVDNALWDLKARLFGVPLVVLLGKVQERVEVYGSGGFTCYSIPQLQRQLGDWAANGIRMVKMKVGSEPERDVERVRSAREAIGREVQLFVDANGAYSRKQALAMAECFAKNHSRGRLCTRIRALRLHRARHWSHGSRKTKRSLAKKFASEQTATLAALAMRYGHRTLSTSTHVMPRFPTIEISPLATWKRSNRHHTPWRNGAITSAHVTCSCQTK